MSRISHVNDDAFDATVLSHQGVCVVDFWAPWCAPCRSIAVVLEECAETMPHLAIFKMNVDDNNITRAKYNVRGIPTLLLIQNGELLDTKVGALSSVSFKEWLAGHGIS